MLAEIEPRTSALVILDMQNDVVHADGKLSGAGAAAFCARAGTIGHIRRLAGHARGKAMAVVHVHHVLHPRAAGQPSNAALFTSVADAGALTHGTWGCEPVDGLKPEPGDLVLQKQLMSGFSGTDLDLRLRRLRVEKIVLTGAWTNFSVESTCRIGADLGYRVVMVANGTATMSDEWQRAALDYAVTQLAEIAPVDEVIAAIR